MLVEQYFVDRGNYPKVSETSTPIDAVEWFAKNKGITNLDDPKVKVRSIIDDVNESEMARHEAKRVREARARSEYIDALFALDDGTAVHRQKNTKNDALKKAKAIKKSKPKVAKAVAKPAKKVAKVAKVAKPVKKAVKILDDSQLARKNKRHDNRVRRAGMTETLKAGGAIYPIDWRGEGLRAHQRQSYDLMMIGQKEGVSIVRVNEVGTNKMRFIIDTFERCDIAEPISSLITSPDSAKLFEIIRSGQMLTVDNIKENVVAGARAMTYLSRAYDIAIYSVVKSNKTVGWVMVDASELQVRTNNEVAAHAPTSTPHEILEAAYREFKRVAKDTGSTISEVLAVKEGQ